MINDKDRALKIAELLLQVKAVKLQPNDPFTWASGIKSPIYCDNRITLSHPTVRTHIRQMMSEAILENFGKPDIIVGVATGAIALGVLVAQELGLPFVYVRSAAKGHGRQNLIEGAYESGQEAVVIEDLISTGGSSLKAVESLREAGIKVKGLTAIFTYGFETAEGNFNTSECAYTTLTDYTTLLEEALDSNYIEKKQLTLLREWRMNPENWLK